MSTNKPRVCMSPREENQDHISSVPKYKDDQHSIYEMPHLSHCKNTLKFMVTAITIDLSNPRTLCYGEATRNSWMIDIREALYLFKKLSLHEG